MALSRGQNKGHRLAPALDPQMDFSSKSSPRTAWRLVPLALLAPAVC